MPSIGQNTGQIRVAGTGKLLVAPVGTTAPTDTVAAWGVGWQDLGFTSDAGITFSKKDSFDTVPLWQIMVPGRYVPKERNLSFKFELVQLNSVTLPLWGGGGTVAAGTGVNEYTYQVSPTLSTYERALGIEFTDGTAVTYRFVVARGMVTDTTDIALTRAKAATLGVTFECLAVDTSTPLVNMIMKDSYMIP